MMMSNSVRIVPFLPGMKLGSDFNAKQWNAVNRKYTGAKQKLQINESNYRYSFVNTPEQLCDVLMIPIEYALKGRIAQVIDNNLWDVFKLFETPNSKTLIFRLTFIKERRTMDVEEKVSAVPGDDVTHWVSQIDIGNELVVILNFNDDVIMKNILGGESGELDADKINSLYQKVCTIHESNIMQGKKDIECRIKTIGLKHAKTWKDSIQLLKDFVDNTKRWESTDDYVITKTMKHILENENKDDPEERTPLSFYRLRATLKSFHKGKTYLENESFANDPTSTEFYNILLQLFYDCPKAKQLLQSVLAREEFKFIVDDSTMNDLYDQVLSLNLRVKSIIETLDLVSIHGDVRREVKKHENFLKIVEDYINKYTRQIPTGIPTRILTLGRAGHGKSSTANRILDESYFPAGGELNGVTKNAMVKTKTVDGREVTIVDMPGVFVTSSGIFSAAATLSREFSQAIAKCPEGFHVLLLIFSYGMRVTAEEKRCVQVLKRMLGEDVFANYGIIVITKGDACKENGDTPISKWLKSEKFFKDLLEECGERCVLFENKTADPIVKIEQRVLLFHYIDKLGGKVFSSGLFELAKKRRSNLLIEKGFSENEDNTFRTNCDEMYTYLRQLKQDKPIEEKIIEQIKNTYCVLGEPENNFKIQSLQICFDAVIIEHGMYSILGKSFTKQVPCVGHLIQCLHEVLKDICHIDHLVALDVEEKNCFPKGSSVLLENGRKELVENLSPGMKVLTFDKKKGFVYDEIYMFGHKQGNTESKFVVIHTESHQISISPEHLILCKKNDTESFVAAKTVSVGDEILTKSELGFVWSSVADVAYRVDRGLYAPFTRSGTIVVDGVVASCYIDVLPHDVCHRMVSPIRCLYRVSPSLVRRVCGVSDTQPVPKIARLALTVLWYGKKISKEQQRALKLFG